MQKTVNLTEVQTRKQIDAMRGVDLFEIGVRDGKTGKMLNIEVDGAGVIAALSRLKRENARGCDIYIRPLPRDAHPLILLDDVGAGAINKMRANGIVAALEVETSPGNYQAMVRLPDSLTRDARKVVERLLAERYGADLNSADGGHYGRLAGFTNRKPCHIQDDGRSPFCKLSACRPHAVLPESIWADLRAAIAQRAGEFAGAAPKAHLPLGAAAPHRGGVIMGIDAATESAKRQYAFALKKWGAQFDPSRADYFVARNLMQRGATEDVARRAIMLQSPDLESRKRGHLEDYLDRTIGKAYSSIPGVSERDEPSHSV